MSIRKRNWRKELEALGPAEDSGELESLEEIPERATGQGDAGEGSEAEAEEIATH
jgi:hypothetical protein